MGPGRALALLDRPPVLDASSLGFENAAVDRIAVARQWLQDADETEPKGLALKD
jgi:hypothetical protein